MEKKRAKQLRNLREKCEHCIDAGVEGASYYCAIAMALLGVQNDMTECKPTPIGDNLCETDVKNPTIKINPKYESIRSNASLIM